ncbi:hypothetical protein DFH06DRAFT_1136742 [Mycena polygramma]|nr:hypothetical protein DFH06DRAFT_1136742 [Mycena polygramma]
MGCWRVRTQDLTAVVDGLSKQEPIGHRSLAEGVELGQLTSTLSTAAHFRRTKALPRTAMLYPESGSDRHPVIDPSNVVEERVGVPPDAYEACANCLRKKSELCSTQTLKHCQICNMAAYCGKACQKANWPSHKGWCKLQSLINAMSGNGPGRRDDSLALVRHGEPEEERTYPKQHYAPRCANCRKKPKSLPPGVVLKRCNACGTSDLYCGDVCQKEHWHIHKKMCLINREAKTRLDTSKSKYPKLRADLQKFCSTFQAEFADGALYALRVHFNRLASLASAFEVALLYTPEEDKAHCRFKLVNWKCVPLALVEKCILEAIVLPTIEKVVESDPECLEAVHLFVIYRVSIPGSALPFTQTNLIRADPDIGLWNACWEDDMVNSIAMVQHGAPKLGRPGNR